MARTCATMPHHFELANTSPEYRIARRTIELQNVRLAKLARSEPFRIPVVVHVLYSNPGEDIDDATVESQIEVLNQDFRRRNSDIDQVPAPFAPYAADAMIEFVLANRDPSGAATTGITRRQIAAPYPYDSSDRQATTKLDATVKQAGSGVAAWPRDSYLNIWVCPIAGELLGYAQFPGGAAPTDGVVISITAFGVGGSTSPRFGLGRTAVHEVGHWLNLLHIWGDDKGGCERGDNVSDTPNQANSNEGVPEFPKLSCSNGPHGDMFMNFMDYSDDEALLMFTHGQVERMTATLIGARASLAISKGYVPPTGEPGAGFMLRTTGAFSPTVKTVFDGVDWV